MPGHRGKFKKKQKDKEIEEKAQTLAEQNKALSEKDRLIAELMKKLNDKKN